MGYESNHVVTDLGCSRSVGLRVARRGRLGRVRLAASNRVTSGWIFPNSFWGALRCLSVSVYMASELYVDSGRKRAGMILSIQTFLLPGYILVSANE